MGETHARARAQDPTMGEEQLLHDESLKIYRPLTGLESARTCGMAAVAAQGARVVGMAVRAAKGARAGAGWAAAGCRNPQRSPYGATA